MQKRKILIASQLLLLIPLTICIACISAELTRVLKLSGFMAGFGFYIFVLVLVVDPIFLLIFIGYDYLYCNGINSLISRIACFCGFIVCDITYYKNLTEIPFLHHFSGMFYEHSTIGNLMVLVFSTYLMTRVIFNDFSVPRFALVFSLHALSYCFGYVLLT